MQANHCSASRNGIFISFPLLNIGAKALQQRLRQYPKMLEKSFRFKKIDPSEWIVEAVSVALPRGQLTTYARIQGRTFMKKD
jgi:hypothetical protein